MTAARTSAAWTLDAATIQAVIEYRTALRALRDINRVPKDSLSPAALRVHNARRAEAYRKCDAARLGLVALLEEDA